MSVIDAIFAKNVAAANLRAMRKGDVWTVTVGDMVHTTGRIQRGHSFCFLVAPNSCARCGATLNFTGHATPGRPTCEAKKKTKRSKKGGERR